MREHFFSFHKTEEIFLPLVILKGMSLILRNTLILLMGEDLAIDNNLLP